MSEHKERLGAYPMRIQVLQGSRAETLHYRAQRRHDDRVPERRALAPGARPAPEHDLIKRGGKTIPNVAFQNVYLGSSSDFAPGDVASIDDAITRVLRDPRLSKIMKQYFPDDDLSYDVAPSLVLQEAKPIELDEPDVQDKVVDLFDAGLLAASDLDRTCFNLILPPDTLLSLGSSTSSEGLGGYHGSVHVIRQGMRRTLYYSANVYTRRHGGSQNGIVAFDAPWKNVVGTLYHELVEFQTDPDVSDAIREQDLRFIGYNSQFGEEIGDQPIAANALATVFREVITQPGSKPAPVQFVYSNAVHGAGAPDDGPQ
jgi:hypothetical protein